MKNLKEFSSTQITTLFTDIDDTLTTHGRLPPESYEALWKLQRIGLRIVPLTGRPAGWCEMIARQWPVHGVIGENGAFYFRYQNNKMQRYFVVPESQRIADKEKLQRIQSEVLSSVRGTAVASDQFCRLFDLAIDFCEDVPPLDTTAIKKIVTIFEKHGATAKVSSIHVNGWFGEYDKLTTCKIYCQRELGMDDEFSLLSECAFIGDSPNDEPMFGFFTNSFAVANIQDFKDQLRHFPKFVSNQNSALGFVEFSERLIQLNEGAKI
jgi:HAD superfamily hydrolase (TIGR01484 family)